VTEETTNTDADARKIYILLSLLNIYANELSFTRSFPTKIVQVYDDIAYQAWFLQAQLAHLEHNALAQVSTA
jgi:hypothetical protein